jgi:hypothetical protein
VLPLGKTRCFDVGHHASFQELESGPTVHLALDDLEPVDLTFDRAVGPRGRDRQLHRLGQVADQVEAIVDLLRRRSGALTAIPVQQAPVPNDDLHSQMGVEPVREAVGRPTREQVDDASPVEIHQHGPVALLLAPSPVVDPENADCRGVAGAVVVCFQPEKTAVPEDLPESRSALGPGNIDITPFPLLRRGGVLVEYGNPLSFRGLLRALAKTLALDLLPNGRKVKCYGASAFLPFNRKPFLEDWAVLFRLLEEGKIRPVISGVFPLLEAARANALLESGQVVGNLVLVAPELLEGSRTV